jgi:signal transduction histidine kinase
LAQLVDEEQGLRLELAAVTTIGRAASCQIRLQDRLASRLHAEVRALPGGRHLLLDLDSAHGTFVGSRRIDEHVLAAGDVITIGATRLAYQPDSSGAAAGAAGDGIAVDRQPDAAGPPPADSAAESTFAPASELADEDQLRRGYEQLRAALSLNRAIAGSPDRETLCARIAETTFGFLAADRIAVLTADASGGRLQTATSRERSGHEVTFRPSSSVIEEAVDRREGVLLLDAGRDERFGRADSVLAEGIRSVMCVPMLHGQDLAGVIYIDSLAASHVFDQGDLEIFAAIAGQAAMAFGKVRLRAELTALNRELQQRVDEQTRALRQAQHQLVEAKKMAAVGELGAGVAHRINNPLWGIASLTQLLLERHPADDPDHELLASIAEEAQRIRDVVSALLDHSQGGDSGMTRLAPADLIGELALEHREQLQRRELDLELAVPDDTPAILGRYTELKRAFAAIIDNACQAMSPGGRLQISARGRPGEVVELRFSDNGPGMDRQALERAFEPFYTERADAGHRGLGLSTVYHLIHQHKGRVSIDSAAEGGTTVSVTLPALSEGPRLA